MNTNRNDSEPQFLGSFHVTDDLDTFYRQDVRFLVQQGRLIDSRLDLDVDDELD